MHDLIIGQAAIIMIITSVVVALQFRFWPWIEVRCLKSKVLWLDWLLLNYLNRDNGLQKIRVYQYIRDILKWYSRHFKYLWCPQLEFVTRFWHSIKFIAKQSRFRIYITFSIVEFIDRNKCIDDIIQAFFSNLLFIDYIFLLQFYSRKKGEISKG